MVATMATSACLSSTRYGDLDRQLDAIPTPVFVPADDGAQLFTKAKILDSAELVRTVLARNPTIERARQAWRAAVEKYPQAVSYDDPWATYTIAPATAVSSSVDLAQTLQVSQAIPYPGKLQLRGEIALAEAEARREDYRALRQHLGLMAMILYYDYYFFERALDINQEFIDLLVEDRDTIAIRMEAGTAWTEDATQVDVDIVDLRQQRLSLEASRDVVVAQINSMLHRRGDLPLPPPPPDLTAPPPLGVAGSALRAEALRRRPELSASAKRTLSAESSVALAEREYYPDFRVSGTYNSFMSAAESQFVLGVGLNLPVQRERRRAAVDEAKARLRRNEADTTRLQDEIGFDVEKAHRHAVEADAIVAMYRDQLLPAARDLVVANRDGLDTGRTNFVEVIRAERSLKTVELRYFAAIADAYRRRAEIDRAVGRMPGLPRDGGTR